MVSYPCLSLKAVVGPAEPSQFVRTEAATRNSEDIVGLVDEIQTARKKVVTDGYEMSLGEIINLYKDKELVIDPIFQRLYRWEDERKTRFVESLILGIPVPPIFVYQDESGVWELIDGLQRISTVLQLTGDLDGDYGPLVLNGTRFLPSLDGKRWTETASNGGDGIGQTLQIEIKRARMRVEILKAESDVSAKFELFQRLNTGGAILTPQEVRNCIAVSLNRDFHRWLMERANDEAFVEATSQTQSALDSQAGVELALRFIAFRTVPYKTGMDVHEYLDDALIKLATETDVNLTTETKVFSKTFGFLRDALGKNAFKRWNGKAFAGSFLMSNFEVMATGVAHNVEALGALELGSRNKFIRKVAKELTRNVTFTQYSGAGVRGSTRLAHLLPIAADVLKP